MKHCSNEFDEALDTIGHYQNYPDMKPWVGCEYAASRVKILIIGESHYLDVGSTYHHNPEEWYAGVTLSDKEDKGWVKTRNIISNGIKSKWKSKSKTIYRNIEKVLFESEADFCSSSTAFSRIAFLNYFQRPAEQTGKSIKVSQLDADVSKDVVGQVAKAIAPEIIIFTSSLAYRHAKRSGLLKAFDEQGIKYTRTPHPGMPWWNRVSKVYGNRTGKQHFVDFVNSVVKTEA
ncbi:hypothetical protein C9I94_14950 [Photobacterium swingsii]|uniref:Uracil-DNA glycosylase-like domain-containing protein n=1 Tax=Photobacterium swingsii TaxID=680026 RepID=A0A2T3P4H4_9GAMM|nr:hypothetical protein [Photobacterium swingsii]PSW23424.1 hypothetical protein C9I94_14950 [Photobacterium swingsii]